ncbi:hypothetical protein GCM10010171_22770 [Actinokineospora fastidiosa]|uniref:Recombinase domain-containing protein n=1 Tax=Actinokineospora fastidiosa TaxID=1816 RepID=A0A918GEU5_9PSEU|nr:hypothetical protein GCM10010171_22770 [Actinokineospora fastidiosa]
MGFQDPVMSVRWQRDVAEDVVAGHGVIVAEFVDVGFSRRLSWEQRPEAAELLVEARTVGRRFDAVVVGEYERAFFGDQFDQVMAELFECGVRLWLPELGGPVDPGDPVVQALMRLLGAQSRREVLRTRVRVLAAMEAQVREQGRFQGGRPPYGYQVVDGGAHPNRVHARWGRRIRRLDRDPATAPWVEWMFARRLSGHSLASIARALNEQGVPCPSGVDPQRNRHRSGQGWALLTVAAILGNPRYTGRQVWNRQRTDRDPTGQAGVRRRVQRWNDRDDWVISKAIVHPPLVDERTFVAVQRIRAMRPTRDGETRTYLLAGLLRCRVCGRRMDCHWVHERAGYRCRHGHSSTRSRPARHPKNLYLREDRLLERLPEVIASVQHMISDPPESPPPQPEALTAFLRLHDLAISCDHSQLTVVADTHALNVPLGPSRQLTLPMEITDPTARRTNAVG